MSSLPKWLQKIKDRTDKATEGPWATCQFTKEYENAPDELGIYWCDAPGNSINGDGSLHVCLICRGMDGPTKEANSQFIAHARDDVPKLIELVEEMARALEGTEIPLRLASDALYKTDKHDLFRETAQAQFQVQAMLRKYRGEDEDG